jgi:hypothetical protein
MRTVLLFIPQPTTREVAMPDSVSSFLIGWGPFIVFFVAWLIFMRRYRFNRPWDQITQRLEGIETQLSRIVKLLEEQRGK